MFAEAEEANRQQNVFAKQRLQLSATRCMRPTRVVAIGQKHVYHYSSRVSVSERKCP